MQQIHIPDIGTYNEKIQELSGGNTVIVADFDFTITHGDRGLCKSSFGLMETMKGNISAFIESRGELYQKYQPYEHAPERDTWMKEWWQRALNLCKTHNITQQQLTSIDWGKSPLRDGWKEFLDFCHANKVPVHILSAGINQTITGILDFQGIPTSNISIISNELLFDSEGICIGHNPDPPIYTGNKKDHTTHGKGKKIILFGDHIDDAEMTDEATLRVGFYNPGDRTSIEEFFKRFDVVIESAGDDVGYLSVLAQHMGQ